MINTHCYKRITSDGGVSENDTLMGRSTSPFLVCECCRSGLMVCIQITENTLFSGTGNHGVCNQCNHDICDGHPFQ